MIPSSKIQSLTQVCIEQICKLLKRGTWNRCVKNPFSSMPVYIVDILMAFLSSVPNFITTRHMRLIFQSGKISKLELTPLLLDKEKHLLLQWMSTDACKNLRILTLSHPLCDESVVSIVVGILQRCHNLEKFHSKLVIDLNALRNCNELESLRLHLQIPINAISEDFNHKVVDFAQSKQHLKIFSFCNIKDGFSTYKTIAGILENCPKLTSVGFADTLEALHHIRNTRSTIQFNLQKCFWGTNEGDLFPARLPRSSPYCEKFPDIIQNAVHMCPDVETLVINVHHEDALQHLVHLKQLKSLSLKFIYKSAENVTSLIFLLRHIGHLLKHLSLDINDTFPVEVIRDHCINLKSLYIYGTAVLSDDTEDDLRPLKLERLYVWKAEPSSLYLLLRNSPNLIELYLGNVACFDDQLMSKILGDSFMFPRLTVIGIMESALSPNAVQMLFSRACNLKEIFFGSMDPYKQVHELIIQNGLTILHYFDTFKLKRKEFYIYRPDPCSF